MINVDSRKIVTLVFACLAVFAVAWSAHATSTFIVQQGGTGTTTAPASQLLYGGGNGVYQSVATTSVSCSGSASCSGFTVIGTSPVTISSSGSGGSGTVSTSTNETQGFLPYWTTTSATPALLGKVATTSVTCAGTVSCTTFTAIGGSPITLTGTGGSASGLSTTSPISAGNLLEYSSAGAGSAFGISTSTLSITGPFVIPNPITVVGSNGAVTYTGLATTSQPSSSQLLTSNGGAGVYGTGTSTLTASSPLTGSFTQVGSGGSLGCQTASGSQAGCLSSTDWNTFNNKQATISVSAPLRLTGTTIDWTGLATTSQPASSNLLVSNGLSGVYPVATSTASLGLGLSGSLTTVGSGQSLTIATSSLYSGTTGQVPYFSGTNALIGTSSIFIATNQNVGIGSTTPSTLLTVQGAFTSWSATPSHIGTSCGTAAGGGGNNGIGGLEICGSDNSINGIQAGLTNINDGASSYSFWYQNNAAANSSATTYAGLGYTGSHYNDGTFGSAANVASQFQIWNAGGGPISLIDSTTSSPYINFIAGGSNLTNEIARIVAANGGGVGIGTTSPHATFSVNAGSTTPTRNLIEASYSTGAANNSTTTVFSVASSTNPAILLGTTTPANGSTSATSTIYMQKLQWQGGDSGGTTRCVFVNTSGSLTVQSGPCN